MISAGNSERCSHEYFSLKGPSRFIFKILNDFAMHFSQGDSRDLIFPANDITSDRTAFVLNTRRGESWSQPIDVDGRAAHIIPFPFGTMCLAQLALDPKAFRSGSCNDIDLYVPRTAFAQLNGIHGGGAISDLVLEAGGAANDVILAGLGACLSQAVARFEQSECVVVDQIAQALHTHLAYAYGKIQSLSASYSGLAPWQLKRATEMLTANLECDVAIAEVAEECRLSRSHFARAFRQSTGAPPHKWLLERRVEVAKELMLNTRLPLVDVALSCGFSDQSHFTRIFSRFSGWTPSAWRRQGLAGATSVEVARRDQDSRGARCLPSGGPISLRTSKYASF
jgi:AraC family transcriptional regulator